MLCLQDGLLTWLPSWCWLVTERGLCSPYGLSAYQLYSKGNHPPGRNQDRNCIPSLDLALEISYHHFSSALLVKTSDKAHPAWRERDIDFASYWGNDKVLEEHSGKEISWSFGEWTICHNLTPESGFPPRRYVFNCRMTGMSSYPVIR